MTYGATDDLGYTPWRTRSTSATCTRRCCTCWASTTALLTEDPLGKGWMVKLQLSDAGELAALMDEAAYQAHCAAEQH
jgi:hypothetical protein